MVYHELGTCPYWKHQISPCNINAYSPPEVMRIKDMITHGKVNFLDILIPSQQNCYKKIMGTRYENLLFDIKN